MEVALEQGGVDDLQQLLLGFDGGSAFHERGSARLVIRVIQLLYQLAPFLQRPKCGIKARTNLPLSLDLLGNFKYRQISSYLSTP